MATEAVEILENKFFVGVQFYQEFKSRPNKVQPLFKKFVETLLEKVS